eukprot:jgi/Chlat1/1115/Chrsp110S00059
MAVAAAAVRGTASWSGGGASSLPVFTGLASQPVRSSSASCAGRGEPQRQLQLRRHRTTHTLTSQAAPISPVTRTMASVSQGVDPVKDWILSEGGAREVRNIRSISGGCVNSAYQYQTDAGDFFVKTHSSLPVSMFESEAAGLGAMHETGTVRVPKPLKYGTLSRGAFIIMEYISPGSGGKDGQAKLGKQLADMHLKGTTDKGFGFDVDNTIGSTPQPNGWMDDWVEFYRVRRLQHQLNLARHDSNLYSKGMRLLDKLPEFFKGMDIKPALLHGDLWSGNISYDSSANPVILDPATYYGHSEAEFGMSWCAGFSSSFWQAYHEVIPREPGFEDRHQLYMLYHYLNHFNMFGGGYRSSAASIISSLL